MTINYIHVSTKPTKPFRFAKQAVRRYLKWSDSCGSSLFLQVDFTRNRAIILGCSVNEFHLLNFRLELIDFFIQCHTLLTQMLNPSRHLGICSSSNIYHSDLIWSTSCWHFISFWASSSSSWVWMSYICVSNIPPMSSACFNSRNLSMISFLISEVLLTVIALHGEIEEQVEK